MNTYGIRYKGQSYIYVNIVGDGLCLFHSIAASDKIPIKDGQLLRIHVYQNILKMKNTSTHSYVINRAFHIFGKKNHNTTLTEVLEKNMYTYNWGNTMDIIFAALVFNINIISISNDLSKFDIFSTEKFLQNPRMQQHVNKNAEIIHIYNHNIEDPFHPNEEKNHFAYLRPCNNMSQAKNVIWYERKDPPLSNNVINVEDERLIKDKNHMKLNIQTKKKNKNFIWYGRKRKNKELLTSKTPSLNMLCLKSTVKESVPHNQTEMDKKKEIKRIVSR